MKKVLAIILTLAFVVPMLSSAVSADVGTGQCYYLSDLNGTGIYSYFDKFSMNANDSIISFDMSMSADSEGNPRLDMNYGNPIVIESTKVTLGSTNANITWGPLENEHWRHIDVVYLNGTATLSIDGVVAVTATNTLCRVSGITMNGWPGNIMIDNLNVTNSSGVSLLALSFDDETYYLNQKNGDSTATRTSVPANSYTNYTPEPVADDYSVLFDSTANTELLQVTGGASVQPGDVNGDGKINAKDSLLIRKYNGGLINSDAIDMDAADVDRDGKINSTDALTLRMCLAGVTTKPEPISGGNGTAEFNNVQSAAKLIYTGENGGAGEAYIDLSAQNLSAEDYDYIVITYMTPNKTEVEKNSAVAVSSAVVPALGSSTPTAAAKKSFSLNTNGKFHAEAIDMTSVAAWTGSIYGLQFIFFEAANTNDAIYIDSVYLCANEAKATAAVSARETTKKTFGLFDAGTVVDGELGAYDGEDYVVAFNSADKMDYVQNTNNSTHSYDSGTNSMLCTATAGADPSIYVDLTGENISADTFKYMVYTYRIPLTTLRSGVPCNFYYVCGSIDVPTGGYETDVYSLTKDNSLHFAVVDLSQKSNWSGDIKGMRIDFFTDCSANDKVYIDSLVFCTSAGAADAAGYKRTGTTPPAPDTSSASAIWNTFWGNAGVSGDEFIVGSGTNLNMYFNYTSASALTQTSLGARFAKAIKRVTGVDVEAEVYTGFIDMKSAVRGLSNGGSTSKNMQFAITATSETGEEDTYCVWIPTTITITSSASTDLNGDDTLEPDPSYPDLNQTSALGVTVSDVSLLLQGNGLAAHSNHETRLLHTANKTFAVYPVGSTGEWNAANSATFQIFEIYADGTYNVFYTGSMRNSSSKPQIMQGYDGKVYVFFTTDYNNAYLDAYYFDPTGSSYNVSKVSATKSYSGGQAAGGYGYTQPIIDNVNKKVYVIFCGGASGTGDFAWFIFNQESKVWESTAQHVSIGNRHCYVYGYADGNGGVNLVAERDILLTSLGLAGTVYGADYAWDELTLFHIGNMYQSSYTKDTFAPADYTQTGRSLFPIIQNNSWGDTYLADDGKLHILYQKSMHGNFHHDMRYREIWHAVYDTNVNGTPELIYNKPIKFVNEENYYACRFAESTDGDLYIFAMPANKAARCEIWASADADDFTFAFDSAKSFSNTATTDISLIVTGPRNGSTEDNKFGCMYPVDGTYRYFTVTLP